MKVVLSPCEELSLVMFDRDWRSDTLDTFVSWLRRGIDACMHMFRHQQTSRNGERFYIIRFTDFTLSAAPEKGKGSTECLNNKTPQHLSRKNTSHRDSLNGWHSSLRGEQNGPRVCEHS